MPERKQVLQVVKEWAHKAECDWLTATHLMTLQQDFVIDATQFHAQQSAEKYLKALMVFHGLPVPRTHDIEALVGALGQFIELEVSVEELRLLSTAAVTSRYPGPEKSEHDDAERTVKIAKKIRAAIRQAIG